MRNTIFCLLALACLGLTRNANADYVIDISGVPNSDSVTFQFSGGSTASFPGVIQTLGSGFTNGDTGELDPVSFINNIAIQDLSLPGVGNATITIGGTTEEIAGIFLDEDFQSVAEEDDLGIRTVNELAYDAGDIGSWSGSLVFAGIDITDFNPGSYVNFNPGASPSFAGPLATDFRVNISVVPEPSAFLAVCIVGLATVHRRRK